ncbi:MAG: hypothetical protein KAJ93_00390 [Methanosarcinales archaeon]|nr:hypothetical protein [Methanosarcinales archaeon]
MTISPFNNGSTIIIPSSFTAESKDQRIKTYKVGQIARAAAVFRVNNIIIYRDPQFDDTRFIKLLLAYVETPQYLRKRLFPLKEQLRYAGTLPPLRTPHHPIESRSSHINVGEYRVGVVVSQPKKKISEKKVGSDKYAWVDIGIDSPVPLKVLPQEVSIGERVNVRISLRRPLQVKLVEKDEIPLYWGYSIIIANSLSEALKELSKQGALIIVTGRQGQVLNTSVLTHIGSLIRHSSLTAIVFGSPKQGVESILANEGTQLSHIQCETLNIIPEQGTATVRTEEAIWATLSVLNLVR